MRRLIALFMAMLLALSAAGLAEAPEKRPEAAAEATPTPEPPAPEKPMILMADPQVQAQMAVGGLFASGSTVLGSAVPRDAITGIRFENTIFAAPDDAWDVSADGDFSVLAWVRDGTLIVAGEGGVWANPNSSRLFAGYTALEQIDFGGCFHLELAEDLSHMFEGDWSLTSLDLSGMITPRATDMSYMFSSCTALAELDVSGLYTGNVTSMEGMFLLDAGLTSLNLSNFDGDSAENRRSMFEGCAGLRELTLGNFGFEGAKQLERMFADCAALRELDAGGAYAGDAETEGMFENCPAKLVVDGVSLDAADWAAMGSYVGLRRGVNGDPVRWLQTKLQEAGCALDSVDGSFGPATEAALLEWQTAHGFEATGETDRAQVLAMMQQ